MNHRLIISSSLFLGIVGCSTDGDRGGLALRATDRAALAELGIADVEVDGHHIVLADADGDVVGEVVVGAAGAMAVELDDAQAERIVHHDGATLECNGAQVHVEHGIAGAQPTDASALAACTDAFEAAAIVTAAHEGIPTDDGGFRRARECIHTGSNIYCAGGTAVVSNDWYCTGGGADWVESDTRFYPGAAYCA